MKKLINFWLIVFVIAFIVNSCGARKSETHKKEETTKTDFSGFFGNSGNSLDFLNTNFNLQHDLFSKTGSNNVSEIDEFTVEPKDSSKLAVYIDPYGNKHTLENSKLTSKKSKQNINTKSEKSEKIKENTTSNSNKEYNFNAEHKANLNAESIISEADKNVKRDEWSPWNLFWLLIPIAIISGIWKLYKIYKNKKSEV